MREQTTTPLVALALWLAATISTPATPANRVALEKHYDQFLAKSLARCTTCHLPSDKKNPESLEEFPHNPFGHRLRLLGEELAAKDQAKDLAARLQSVAREDADADGTDNETEILLGHNPGDTKDFPGARELESAGARRAEFARFLTSYRWEPFQPVRRPAIPAVSKSSPQFAPANPIDAFLEAERRARGLRARPEAPREVLLRRVYIDLIGLNPTPEEQRAFLDDTSPQAYEKVVDRLLADPRHGERWGRHWMDVWRYSDWAGWTDGGQIRDSKPHIWRWRDWIVESLNADKPYDRMLLEMLAADELAPEDTDTLRATGFLVRNYKMLSREQWLEDTIKHTSQAFLGVTMGCAKCHDHMFDPISQRDYYSMRAIFEPHQVRTDRVTGQLDTAKDGLPRAYDATNAPTYFFVRGDERHPLTNEVIQPGVPAALGGRLESREVKLPWLAANPDHRAFVIAETLAAIDQAVREAESALSKARGETNATIATVRAAELAVDVARKKHAALLAVLDAERSTDGSNASSAATNAVRLQRAVALAEAKLKQHQAQTAQADAQQKAEDTAHSAAAAAGEKLKSAQDAASKAAAALTEANKKSADAAKQLADALAALAKPADGAFKPRVPEKFPATSTGRRLAFAQWLASTNNPLAARVAVNHVWLRHFGRGLAPTPSDFGRNGRAPTHPQLLDWLAAEFMSGGWSMRHLHRLIVTSTAYRMASTPDEACASVDPDNVFLWRMNSRRLEAEAVRDNVLYASGQLDLARGGADVDHKLALSSRRRSIYLRHAAEKQAEFLQIFDGPSVTECYERHPSVMPQQALALANSELALQQARRLAEALAKESGENEEQFVELAFRRLLARAPSPEEMKHCREFLAPVQVSTVADRKRSRPAENLVLVLFNHNDFVTVR